MVMHCCKPSTPDAEALELKVQDQPVPHSWFPASLSYETLSQKKKI
jgi:hypothetical protein